MDTGFITLHRKVTENPIWKNSQLVHLFITLLLLANHEEKKFLFNGKLESVKRGQLITGRHTLAEQTLIPAGSIPRYLGILEKLGIVNIKANNKFSLITIEKYNDYQNKDGVANIKANNKRTASEQPVNTNNNDNNVNNDNKDTAVLKLWKNFEANPLMEEVKKKYPDRDYKFHFLEMTDWYLTKKKKLPQNISALTNWLKNTKPDEAMQAERLRKEHNIEIAAKQKEMASIPQNLNKLNEIKARLQIKTF